MNVKKRLWIGESNAVQIRVDSCLAGANRKWKRRKRKSEVGKPTPKKEGCGVRNGKRERFKRCGEAEKTQCIGTGTRMKREKIFFNTTAQKVKLNNTLRK